MSRSLVAGAVALALAGCAASPSPRAAGAADAARAPHPIVAQAAPAPAVDATPTAQPSAASAHAEDDAASERASHRTNRTLGWIAVAVGGEAAAAAIVTSLVMLHQNDVRNRECTNKVCSASGYDANAQLSQLGTWNAMAYVVGAVGLGAGIFLLLTNPAEKAQRTAVGVTPGGLTLQGSF